MKDSKFLLQYGKIDTQSCEVGLLQEGTHHDGYALIARPWEHNDPNDCIRYIPTLRIYFYYMQRPAESLTLEQYTDLACDIAGGVAAFLEPGWIVKHVRFHETPNNLPVVYPTHR